MLDIGWSELLMVAVVAIIVIGPKELPRALRTAGQWVAKVRGMAREFQSSIDDMIRDSELDELKKQARSITDLNLDGDPEHKIDPTGGSDGAFDGLDELDEIDGYEDYDANTKAPPRPILPSEEEFAEASKLTESEPEPESADKESPGVAQNRANS